MTLAERLHNEGLQQGMQQGMLEEAREGILDILEARFDVVPESIVKEIRAIQELGILKVLRRKGVVAGQKNR